MTIQTINMPMSPEVFQYLYRLIFCDFDEGVPDELAHTMYEIKETLARSIIIDIKAGPDDGEIPEESNGDCRVFDELARPV